MNNTFFLEQHQCFSQMNRFTLMILISTLNQNQQDIQMKVHVDAVWKPVLRADSDELSSTSHRLVLVGKAPQLSGAAP